MNNQEKAQHIGEIMIAAHERKDILNQGNLVISPINFVNLVEHPERYSIKKEPRVIWMNVFETLRGKIWSCHCETEEAAKKMVAESEQYKYETKTLAEAHPIELPSNG